MESQPFVSIIIPVYNGDTYLEKAIQSALTQTYNAIEIIVVNDGSCDKTEQIALSYGKKIRYFAKENNGVSSALNMGISQMKGDFFSWLSHDDLYYPHKIERQVALSKNYSRHTLFWSDYDVIDAQGQCIDSFILYEENKKSAIFQILSTLIHGCSLLIPKEGFQEVGLFNESLKTVQDNEMWLRFAMAGYQFVHIPEKLICSRRHHEQGQVTMSELNRHESVNFYQWALEILGKETFMTKHEWQVVLNKKGLHV